MTRSFWLQFHRVCGSVTALFLIIAGLTGALISWDKELDVWCNPDLFVARTAGVPQSVFALVAQLESMRPDLQVTLVPLRIAPAQNLVLWIQPRLDPATRKPFVIRANQLFIDPVTGAVVGERRWGDLTLARANLLPLLHAVHSDLLIPSVDGRPWGAWLMGFIAVLWSIDGVVALVLALSAAGHWRKACKFRWRQGGAQLRFDAHRSSGVWLWCLMTLVAVTAVGLAFNREWVRPLVAMLAPLSPSPFANTHRRPPGAADPELSREQVLTLAQQAALHRGWATPGVIAYMPTTGWYSVGFFAAGRESRGLGYPWLYFDGETGAEVGASIPGTGSAGDIFLQAQFPLHSGRILGFYGRIAASLLGLGVAALAATGLVLAWRRRR